jgi:hypothetical protein
MNFDVIVRHVTDRTGHRKVRTIVEPFPGSEPSAHHVRTAIARIASRVSFWCGVGVGIAPLIRGGCSVQIDPISDVPRAIRFTVTRKHAGETFYGTTTLEPYGDQNPGGFARSRIGGALRALLRSMDERAASEGRHPAPLDDFDSAVGFE